MLKPFRSLSLCKIADQWLPLLSLVLFVFDAHSLKFPTLHVGSLWFELIRIGFLSISLMMLLFDFVMSNCLLCVQLLISGFLSCLCFVCVRCSLKFPPLHVGSLWFELIRIGFLSISPMMLLFDFVVSILMFAFSVYSCWSVASHVSVLFVFYTQ